MTRLVADAVGWAVAGRFVLVDVDLALQPGSLTVLSGENGVGKSSLLQILAGNLPPTCGRVSLDGVPLPEIAAAHLARRIAWLDHAPGLYLDLTAAENVTLFAALLHGSAAHCDVAGTLTAMGIAAADHHRPVRGFSRGMLQRTALARVQASAADVWLLDEPSTGLDRDGADRLAATLRTARDRGVTLLVASHDPAVLGLADRRLHLAHGRPLPVEVA